MAREKLWDKFYTSIQKAPVFISATYQRRSPVSKLWQLACSRGHFEQRSPQAGLSGACWTMNTVLMMQDAYAETTFANCMETNTKYVTKLVLHLTQSPRRICTDNTHLMRNPEQYALTISERLQMILESHARICVLDSIVYHLFLLGRYQLGAHINSRVLNRSKGYVLAVGHIDDRQYEYPSEFINFKTCARARTTPNVCHAN